MKRARDWMRLTAALNYCAEHGKAITNQGLRAVAAKRGFSRRDREGRWWFSKKGLDAYLQNVLADPGPGWESIRDVALRFGIGLSTIYKWIRDKRVSVMRIGRRTYVPIDEIKRLATHPRSAGRVGSGAGDDAADAPRRRLPDTPSDG